MDPSSASDSAPKTVKTPLKTYQSCVIVKTGSALEEGENQKVYAPGVGLIQDDEFELVKVEWVK